MRMRTEFLTEDMISIMQYLRRIDATLIRLIPKRYGKSREGYLAVYMVK